MLFNYPFEENRTYLIACSYGPDSMALFDMLIKSKVHIVCCHVNYHKRGEDSDAEERSLKRYCDERSIPFECLDARTIKKEGNFQQWARNVRYYFFAQVYVKYNAAGIFVAHQQDDLIETYIMQRDRNTHVDKYGIQVECEINGMHVIRPLLNYSKEDLLRYDRENNVPYSIDISNLQDDYKRNIIRHNVIEKMSNAEREQYLNEIKEANNELTALEQSVSEKITIDETLDIREIIALKKDEFKEAIFKFVAQNAPVHVDISNGQVDEIRKICLSEKPNIDFPLGSGVVLVKEYDVLLIVNEEDTPEPYSYEIKYPCVFSCPQFNIDFSMGADDRRIHPEDYPLTIRNAHPDDHYTVGRAVLRNVKRLFIDWKVPKRIRKQWPVVCNKNGEVIYIPRYRLSYTDTHKSKFEIKIK